MKIKALSLILVIIMCLSVALAACGDEEESTSTTSTSDSQADVSAEASEEASEVEAEESAEDSGEDSAETAVSEEGTEDSTLVENESGESEESFESVTESSEAAEVSSEAAEESVITDETTETEVSEEATESVEELPAELEYSVTLTNPDGTPCKSGVVIRFMQDGEQIAMQAPNADGVAAKVLPTGDYTVEITFTSADSDVYYDNSGLELSADNNAITVKLLNGISGEPETVYAAGDPYEAYMVEVGSTFLTLNEGEKNYYLFAPTIAGTYEFTTSDKSATVGYYGNRHFIQENNLADVVGNNIISISVSSSGISTAGAGSTELVIAIDAPAGVKECTLMVTRVGDAEITLADMPWTKYQTTATLSDYKLPAGAQLANFDLYADSSKYKIVYNEEDGFYHLDSANGPLVCVWLTEEPAYMACFNTILEHSGVNKYFFDEDGNFEKKEDYGDCLLEYIEHADEESGVYPLTKDLEYIIKNRGEYVGWWDFASPGCIFLDRNGNPDTGINADIAWLFMCCYIK